MPIYEYQCAHCGHEFDELQRLADAPLTDCPECDETELVKLVSAPSFRLKGSGWYETDFKQDNRRNLADNAGSGDGSATNKSDNDSTSASKSAEGSGATKKEAPKASQNTTKSTKDSANTGKAAKKKSKISKG